MPQFRCFSTGKTGSNFCGLVVYFVKEPDVFAHFAVAFEMCWVAQDCCYSRHKITSDGK